VLDLLQLIETIYVPAGVLRPDDSIDLLTGTVPSRAWWRDHFHDLHAGDDAAWLETTGREGDGECRGPSDNQASYDTRIDRSAQ